MFYFQMDIDTDFLPSVRLPCVRLLCLVIIETGFGLQLAPNAKATHKPAKEVDAHFVFFCLFLTIERLACGPIPSPWPSSPSASKRPTDQPVHSSISAFHQSQMRTRRTQMKDPARINLLPIFSLSFEIIKIISSPETICIQTLFSVI